MLPEVTRFWTRWWVAVYNTANTTGKGPTVNVPPGQLVIYDPVTLLTVNVATRTKQIMEDLYWE